VLGTFVGIFIGLLDFEVNKIEESVPRLLDGMKTAFLTSVVGMGTAIAFKMWQTLVPAREERAATSEDPLTVLRSGFEELTGEMRGANAALSTLKAAISGDAESSLATQLQKLRIAVVDSDGRAQRQSSEALDKIMNEGFAIQIAAFQDFAKTIAENNSKALIEALKEVIRDFNAKINEQFGDNFKQLNAAVGRLLEWQEAYRAQLDQLREQMGAATTAIAQSEKSLDAISASAKTLPDSAAALSRLLATAQAQIDDLTAHLAAFADLKRKAEDAMPTVSRILDDFARSMADKTGSLLATLETESKALQSKSDALRSELSRALEGQKAAAEALLAEQQRLNRDTQERFARMSDDLGKKLGGSVDSTAKNLDSFVKALDEQMQEELKRALNVLGKHLATISEKLARDYRELGESVRRLVEVSRGDRP
jgi:DNA anti-recombination protein RmuC